jgi:hypothetical protein
MTIGDAVKAANRFRRGGQKTSNTIPKPVRYKWSEGSIESFKKRLPIGISGEFIDEEEMISKWELEGGAYATFNGSEGIIEIGSRDLE